MRAPYLAGLSDMLFRERLNRALLALLLGISSVTVPSLPSPGVPQKSSSRHSPHHTSRRPARLRVAHSVSFPSVPLLGTESASRRPHDPQMRADSAASLLNSSTASRPRCGSRVNSPRTPLRC